MRCHNDYEKGIFEHIGDVCPANDTAATKCPITCKDKRFYMPKLLLNTQRIENYHKPYGKEI